MFLTYHSIVRLLLLFPLLNGQETVLRAPTPAPPKLPCENPTVTLKTGPHAGVYTYPMSSLQGKMMQGKATGGGTFFLTVCANLPTGKPFCTNKDTLHPTAMAAYCPITEVALSIVDAKIAKDFIPLDLADPSTGLRLTVEPENPVIKGGFHVEFHCDPKSKAPVFKGVMKDTPLGFNFTVTTDAACPTFVPAPSGGWSTIFLVCLCTVTVLYCGLGCGLNIRNGKEVMQACPNRASWCNLPGLVKDGCVFFFQCLCGLCGNGKGPKKVEKKKGGGDNYKSLGNNNEEEGGGGGGEGSGKATTNNYGTSASSDVSSPYDHDDMSRSLPKETLSSTGRHNDRNDDFEDTVF